MKRSCPICEEPKANLWDHLTRIHNMEGDIRQKWLEYEKQHRLSRKNIKSLKEKSEKAGQRFTPYPRFQHEAKNECDHFQLLHPFTALVAGMTGSGKTVWVQNLLEHAKEIIQPAPERIVWSYSQWQPAYDRMIKTVPTIEFVKGIPHDLDEDWYFDPKINNLMVIDDQMMETSNDKRILNLFTKGSHHRNLSVIFLLQNVYFQGKIMRTLSLNAAYLVLFKNPRDKLQMMTLGKQMYPGKTKQFVEKYEAAVQRPYGYLFVDLKPNTRDECRLRTNVLPNEVNFSQSGGQSDDLKAITGYFKRQSYMQPPELRVLQGLEEKMNTILKDPTLPSDVKIKEYTRLLNRYLSMQQQELLITPKQESVPATTIRNEENEPSSVTTPQNSLITTPLSGDSGTETVTQKEPSFLKRLTSKLATPFKASTPQKVEEKASTSPREEPLTSTSDSQPTFPNPVFPPTPPTSKERPSINPRWIRYRDQDKYPDEPPRRSDRIRAMVQSISGWEKY